MLVDVEAVETHLSAVRVDQLVGPEQLPEIGVVDVGETAQWSARPTHEALGIEDGFGIRPIVATHRDEVIGVSDARLEETLRLSSIHLEHERPEISTGLQVGVRGVVVEDDDPSALARKERTKASPVAPAPATTAWLRLNRARDWSNRSRNSRIIPTRAP